MVMFTKGDQRICFVAHAMWYVVSLFRESGKLDEMQRELPSGQDWQLNVVKSPAV